MADCGVSISSVSLSGLTTEVTFFPETGGTINLGTQVFPFTYISDYYYGTYNCYVPTYAYSYTVVVPGITPTPTPTSTETPTPTPTNTETPTPTPTNTETPTSTPTETPTNTPTNTETPTQTQTQTPTNTQTPTTTETPTTTPTPTHTRFGFAVYSGVTFDDACQQINTPTTIYGDTAQFDENTIFYNDFVGPVTIDMTGYYNYEQIVVQLDSVGDTGVYGICNTPTTTPTNTPSPTPTTPLTLYYNSTPICDTINPFENVVMDGDLCSATTLTSSTILPDGTYWIVDTLLGRRDITATSGTYTFNGDCVGCV